MWPHFLSPRTIQIWWTDSGWILLQWDTVCNPWVSVSLHNASNIVNKDVCLLQPRYLFSKKTVDFLPAFCCRLHFLFRVSGLALKRIIVISCLKEKAHTEQKIAGQNLNCFESVIFKLWISGIKLRRKLKWIKVLMTPDVLGTSSTPSCLISKATCPRNNRWTS